MSPGVHMHHNAFNVHGRISSGFPEENGSYREFLFSLPRFANNTVRMCTLTFQLD